MPVDPDIRRARTLPASFWRDPEIYALSIERVFARSWHMVARCDDVPEEGALPVTMLDGCLDEPVVLTRGGPERTRPSASDQAHPARPVLRALSNVCTHRAALVCREPGPCAGLRCPYHGRRFGLDGAFLSMPEMDDAVDFPAASDDLPRVPLHTWGGFAFCGVEPDHSFDTAFAPVLDRLAFADWEGFVLDPAASRDYLVEANWALYLDNFLEGFHVPFVHPSLAQVLDYRSYRTEVFDRCSLQVGIVTDPADAFDLPVGHPDHGQLVGGYYAFLFPTVLLNLYPWGVSVNLVEPLGPARTRVRFLAYVGAPSRRGRGSGADVHQVQLEDEVVVHSVQAGVRSRFYRHGRFSPRREKGVHHFHRLLERQLA